MLPHDLFYIEHRELIYCIDNVNQNGADGLYRFCCWQKLDSLRCTFCSESPVNHVGVKCLWHHGIYEPKRWTTSSSATQALRRHMEMLRR